MAESIITDEDVKQNYNRNTQDVESSRILDPERAQREGQEYLKSKEGTNFIEWLDIFETPISNPIYQAVYNDDWDVIANSIEGIKNPQEAKDWFDFGGNIPDNFIDQYIYSPLWGGNWKEGLRKQDVNQAYDTFRMTVGTTGAIFLDLDTIFGGGFTKLFGLTDEGLTALKLQPISPFLKKATNLDEAKKILSKYNIFGEVRDKALDIFKKGGDFALDNSVAKSIEYGQRAGLVGWKNKPVRLPGTLGDFQKTSEEAVGQAIDYIKKTAKESAPGQSIRKGLSPAVPELNKPIAETFLSGERTTRRMLEDMDDLTKRFGDNIKDIANNTNFNTDELYNLAEFKRTPDIFHGKEVPQEIAQRLDEVRRPLENAKQELLQARGVDFTPFESESLYYLPRETSDEALKAMKENVPEWYDNYFARDIDKAFESSMYNQSLKHRAFAEQSRDFINELSNKGKLGVASNNGQLIEVGNYDELVKKYPELTETNQVKNLTGGNKVDFYIKDPVASVRQNLRRKAKTIGARDTYSQVIERGMATDDIRPLPEHGNPDSGYVKIKKEKAGNLYPLFDDLEMTTAVRDQIKGITEKPSKEAIHSFPVLNDALSSITNNFKKLAIGTSTSYNPKNLMGNLVRSFIDPTTSFTDWIKGQAMGFTTALGDSTAGRKLGLDRLFGVDIPERLPTGEVLTPRQMYQQFHETGGMASGFRQGVVEETGLEGLRDVGRRFSARRESGENILSNLLKTGKEGTEEVIEGISAPGLWIRENLAERPTRAGDYMAHRLTGFPAETAQTRQFENMIDYASQGPAMSEIQTIFPFAKYQVATKPLYWKRMLQTPGQFRWPAKIQNYLDEFGDISEEERKQLEQKSPPPDYQQTPFLSGTDEEGRAMYKDINKYLGGPMDFTPDLIRMLTSERPVKTALEEGQQDLDRIISMLNPVGKGAYEFAAGRDVFREKDIPPVTMLGSWPIGGTSKAGEYASRATHTAKSLFPPSRYLDMAVQDERDVSIWEDLFDPAQARPSYEYPQDVQPELDKIDRTEEIINILPYMNDEEAVENVKKLLQEGSWIDSDWVNPQNWFNFEEEEEEKKQFKNKEKMLEELDF